MAVSAYGNIVAGRASVTTFGTFRLRFQRMLRTFVPLPGDDCGDDGWPVSAARVLGTTPLLISRFLFRPRPEAFGPTIVVIGYTRGIDAYSDRINSGWGGDGTSWVNKRRRDANQKR